jgi:hypothetical protein
MTGATAARIDLRGRLLSMRSLQALSDRELEEQLTVAAAAPGNRLTRIFGQFLHERDSRLRSEAGQRS